MTYKLLLLGLVLHFGVVSPANILAILPMLSPSHHIWNSALTVALAQRGHNLTILTPDPVKPPVPNIKELLITGGYEDIHEEFHYEEMADDSPFESINFGLKYMGYTCMQALKSDAFKELMNYPSDTKFDLIITEMMAVECLLGAVASKFGNPPIVFVHAFPASQLTGKYTGSPTIPSFMANMLYPEFRKDSLWGRLYNLFLTVYIDYKYEYSYIPDADEIARKYLGPHVPPIKDVLNRGSLSLGNFHPVFDGAYPTSPSSIPVGGLQIKEPKPLPKDLQKFLDEATDGAIFFSLGSNIQSSSLPPEKLQAILDAFREIPQRVLWKFELDSLKNIPKNVKIGKWLPQSDILAHPNLKLFISHNGLLSSHETVYRGVPVLGIPFMADQFANLAILMQHGVAERLSFPDLTKETLLKAINTVLHNPSYRENMKSLSERFRDNPMKPLDTAVFWTEYVIKHKGAPHLRPASLDMCMVQYLFLDAVALIIGIAAFVILVPILLCRRIFGKKDKKIKQN